MLTITDFNESLPGQAPGQPGRASLAVPGELQGGARGPASFLSQDAGHGEAALDLQPPLLR